MKRRKFLKGTLATGVAATAAAATSFPKPAISKGRMQWKMVTSWPKNLPGPGTSANWLAERITKMSDGKLTVKVHAAGEIVPASGCFDAVAQGVAEMYHSIPGYWRSKSEGIVIYGGMPFGLTAMEQHAWMIHGGGQALYDEMYGRFGLKGFLCGNTGNQWMGWFKKEFKSLDDFKGVRFRTPGFGGEMYRRVGASVVMLPGSEIFQALQAGTVDAAEFIGPWTDFALGFHQVAKYYYWPGVQEPSSAEECVVNKEKYNALPDDLKEIIATACMATFDYSTAEYILRNPPVLNDLINKHGVKVREMPRDLMLACGKAAGEIVSELAEHEDDVIRRTMRSFLDFRKIALVSAKYTEHAMMGARLLPFKYGN